MKISSIYCHLLKFEIIKPDEMWCIGIAVDVNSDNGVTYHKLFEEGFVVRQSLYAFMIPTVV